MHREVSQELSRLADIFSDRTGFTDTPKACNPSPTSRLAACTPLLSSNFSTAAADVTRIYECYLSTKIQPADRKALLLLLGQPEHFRLLQQLGTHAAKVLAQSDLRCLKDAERTSCVTLYGSATRLTNVVLAGYMQHDLQNAEVLSLSVRHEGLAAHTALLAAARSPKHRQALGPVGDWLPPSIEMLGTLCALLQHLYMGTTTQKATTPIPRHTTPWSLQQRLLCTAEFLEALTQSQCIEQAVRTILLIVLSSGPCSSPAKNSRLVFSILVLVHRVMLLGAQTIDSFNDTLKDIDARLMTALQKLISAPSVNYAAMAHAVAQMALIDGGPLYGMDPEHAAALQLPMQPGAVGLPYTIRSDEAADGIYQDPDWFNCFSIPFQHWSIYLMMAPSGPLETQLYDSGAPGRVLRHAVRKLSLRLLRFVRRTAGVYEDRRRQQNQNQRHQQPQGAAVSSAEPAAVEALLLPESHLVQAAWEALRSLSHCAHRPLVRLGRSSGCQHSGCEEDVKVTTEFWREAVPTVHMMLTLHGGGLDAQGATALGLSFMTSVATPLWPAGDLAPAPPPNLGAALAAGWLALIERSLRHPPAHVFADGPFWALRCWGKFGLALAYGDPLQLEALIITGAKLARRLGATRELVGGPAVGSGHGRRHGGSSGGSGGGGGDEEEEEKEVSTKEAALKALSGLPLYFMKEWLASYAAVLRTNTRRPPKASPPATEGCDGLWLSYNEATRMGIEFMCRSTCEGETSGDGSAVRTCGACSSSSSDSESGSDGDRAPTQDSDRHYGIRPRKRNARAAGRKSFAVVRRDCASSGFLQWAKGPSQQMIDLMLRAVQLWLPSISAAITELAEGSGPDLSKAVIKAWDSVLDWIPSLVGVHTLAAGRQPLPDWWSTCGSGAVEEPKLRDAAARWRQLLLEEMDLVRLLCRVLRVVREGGDIRTDSDIHGVHAGTCIALLYLAAEFPAEVAAEFRSEGRALGPLSPDTACAEVGPGQTETAINTRNCDLRARLQVLQSLDPAEVATAHVDLTSISEVYRANCYCPDMCGLLLDASLRMEASDTGIGHMRTCGNPECVNLDGDSEVVLPLTKTCARCRQVSYCSGACQWAHWTSGHKERCAGMRRDPGGSGA